MALWDVDGWTDGLSRGWWRWKSGRYDGIVPRILVSRHPGISGTRRRNISPL